MPTTKPRYTVTDTGELSRMLDDAQRQWPDVKDRKELLVLLAQIGYETISSRTEARRAAVRDHSGALTGVYRADELTELRKDWPD